MVPETANTCIAASRSATRVRAANEARIDGKEANVQRITAILWSALKSIRANPVKLAPTSPYNLVTEVHIASKSSRSVVVPSHSNCTAR